MIVITEFMDAEAIDTLRAAGAVHYDPGLADRQEAIPPLLRDAAALVVRNRTLVTGALLAAAPRLRCIGRLGVGLDNIDLNACAAQDVTVYPATGANTLSVAEYVVTAALVLLRRAWFCTADMLAGKWPRGAAGEGQEVAGKILGLVGYGAIARETARLARGLGMDVVGHDPFLPGDDPAWGATRSLPLADLLGMADVVSLHVPLTQGTRHLIDSAALANMKPGAILINAARGGVVDETAVAVALRAGHLGAAALDTFENEPLTQDRASAFADTPNLILTPHIAGVTEESNRRVSALTAANIIQHLARQD
ncbi:MAG: hydroxyacid dehydrogenase [Rhodobacteraceae bacterium]|nr:hydroxyacid dehydrogenase [Paracoccaceae bacterium]MCB2117782.1 hydroxyacid dehydrogenase [Paracoccaceae bacterium]MCB2137832.1 hydroxyacid dehydrogenase [Paracoccaceae bacterium]MCB2141995.1 hydroxyacid dehydrogenase [Paracoccaceae bacterium]MCB2150023.1 hydroxyacid dehydrogenase [Paracoccaceae bacterium]